MAVYIRLFKWKPQRIGTWNYSMSTLKQCEEVLNTKEKKYTKEQVKVIREYLYHLAGIVYEVKNNSHEES